MNSSNFSVFQSAIKVGRTSFFPAVFFVLASLDIIGVVVRRRRCCWCCRVLLCLFLPRGDIMTRKKERSVDSKQRFREIFDRFHPERFHYRFTRFRGICKRFRQFRFSVWPAKKSNRALVYLIVP
jgi:hypothetical protein